MPVTERLVEINVGGAAYPGYGETVITDEREFGSHGMHITTRVDSPLKPADDESLLKEIKEASDRL